MRLTISPEFPGPCDIEWVCCERGEAVALRWHEGIQPRVLIYDGGADAAGEALVAHVLDRLDTDFIDHVVCSHPDPEHAGALAAVLGELDVGQLWMHRPWLHASAGHARRLRLQFPAAVRLEQIATRRRIGIREPFRGERIGPLRVLSPCDRWYRHGLLPHFDARARNSAVHESSAVLYGEFSGDGLLLCAGAGTQALTRSADYAQLHGVHLPSALRLWQLCASGVEGWLRTRTLDRLLGPSRLAACQPDKLALVGVAGSVPRQPDPALIDALAQRGARVMVPTHGPSRMHLGVGVGAGVGVGTRPGPGQL